MTQPIRVSLRANVVTCLPDNGDAWVNIGAAGAVRWETGNNVVRFKLDFYRQPMQGNGATSDWPFSDKQPTPNTSSSTGWVTSFEGRVRDETGAYKYTVEVEPLRIEGQAVQTYFLDPMIIIGRG